MINQQQQFLTDIFISIKALHKAKEIYADRIAPDFLLFDFLRDDEIALSRCIHSLLDANGAHAQGTIFLQLFIQRFVKYEWAKNLTLKGIHLERATNASRRIDKGSKREMHGWQHEKILNHKANNGGDRPRMNKSDY
jgi:hypothetical protein